MRGAPVPGSIGAVSVCGFEYDGGVTYGHALFLEKDAHSTVLVRHGRHYLGQSVACRFLFSPPRPEDEREIVAVGTAISSCLQYQGVVAPEDTVLIGRVPQGLESAFDGGFHAITRLFDPGDLRTVLAYDGKVRKMTPEGIAAGTSLEDALRAIDPTAYCRMVVVPEAYGGIEERIREMGLVPFAMGPLPQDAPPPKRAIVQLPRMLCG